MIQIFKKICPSIITCLSIMVGLLILKILFFDAEQIKIAIFLLILIVILDFLDGALARWLKVESAIGANLDSLADFLNFGIIPVFVYYLSIDNQNDFLNFFSLSFYTCCIAIRLARFNSTVKNNNFFTGISSPCAAFILLLPIIICQKFFLEIMDIFDENFIIIYPIVVGLLAISKIKTICLKNMNKWIKVAIFVIGGIFFYFDSFFCIIFGIVIYIFSLPIGSLYFMRKKL